MKNHLIQKTANCPLLTTDMSEQTWHKLSIEEAAEKLNTDTPKGLSSQEASTRIALYGQNQLTEIKGRSVASLILEQFNDFMIWVLIVAAIISAFIPGGEKLDAVVILLIVVLNAILGFIQTFRAEAAIQALKELTSPTASVLRDGQIVEVAAKEIVPGDILLLESGDKIAADCRLIKSMSLATEEAALTGESGGVSKTVKVVDKAMSLGDQKNMVFAGTSIARGRGVGLVVATGDKSELGKIAGLVQEPEEKTPLQTELKKTGFTIAIAVLVIAFVVFIVGLAKGILAPVIFLASVSLAVAAIPEGLPAIITVTLALGVQNMAKKHAIVRRLHAVETLGATNYICSDKTGTITLNRMEVKRIYASGKLFNFKQGKIIGTEEIPEELSILMTTAALANDAIQKKDGQLAGDPTETALIEAADQSGFSKKNLEKEYVRIDEIPFESERKMMTSVNKIENEIFILSKGAPEVLIDKCTRKIVSSKITNLSPEEKANFKITASALASEGYRVLAFAYKETGESYDINKAEEDLIFIGLTGMIDPPREEVKISLVEALGAGIKVSMITGDHANTAKSIAEEVGLLNDRRVLTGADLEKLSVDELAEIVEEVGVYARVNPVHKVKIVEALKKRGHVVAMTGDGVNDAPALKKADIGIAMGITGTDVSKEAADMVLSDDNFASIISAVKEGRVIFDNLKKFTNFLLSCNVSEVLTMFIGTILIPARNILPLLPIQILWINLITDGLPALALGMDPATPGIMDRKPRNSEDGILSRQRIKLISIEGALLTAGALGVFILSLFLFKLPIEKVQTMTFTTLVVSQLIHSLNYRFFNKSVFCRLTFNNRILTLAIFGSFTLQLLVIYVPFLNPIFKTTPLGGFEWLVIIIAVALTEIVIDRVKVSMA